MSDILAPPKSSPEGRTLMWRKEIDFFRLLGNDCTINKSHSDDRFRSHGFQPMENDENLTSNILKSKIA